MLVIGDDVWQSRFGGEPDVVGRTVRLGATAHTIVGVMPEGFAFPMSHSYWTPLQIEAAHHPPGAGSCCRPPPAWPGSSSQGSP